MNVWVLVALLVQSLIAAGTHLVAKDALTSIAPYTLVFWRFALWLGAVFVVLLLLTPGRVFPPRRALARVLFLGFLAGPLNQLLFLRGLSLTVPAHAALLYALTPVGVYGVSLYRRTERATMNATAGVLTALMGVVVLLTGRGLGSRDGVFSGDLLILVAVVAWVFYTSEGKPFVEEHGAMRVTAWTMIAGAIWLLPLAPFYADFGGLNRHAVGVILYLGLLSSVVSYLLWFFALSRAHASHVAVFSNLQPVLTALAAWAFLKDRPTWEMGAGGVLVLLGVGLTQRAQGQARRVLADVS